MKQPEKKKRKKETRTEKMLFLRNPNLQRRILKKRSSRRRPILHSFSRIIRKRSQVISKHGLKPAHIPILMR